MMVEFTFCSVVIGLSQTSVFFVLFSTIYSTAQLLRMFLLFHGLYGLSAGENYHKKEFPL